VGAQGGRHIDDIGLCRDPDLAIINLANGSNHEYRPFATEMPILSVMTLNLLGKMGFGALGGFEYVAIHAGEARDPARTIGRSVAIAAPFIA
jgi:amino acid transporter